MGTAENVSDAGNLEKVDFENISNEKREFFEKQMKDLASETDLLITEIK